MLGLFLEEQERREGGCPGSSLFCSYIGREEKKITRRSQEEEEEKVVVFQVELVWMAVEYHCCEGRFFLHIVIIVLLVVFAGLMSGLTLGLMSLSLVDLEVLAKSGTPQDRKHAGMSTTFNYS